MPDDTIAPAPAPSPSDTNFERAWSFTQTFGSKSDAAKERFQQEWNNDGAGKLPHPVSAEFAEQSIAVGKEHATELLQKALNKAMEKGAPHIKTDGHFGTDTEEALQRVDPAKLSETFQQLRKEYFQHRAHSTHDKHQKQTAHEWEHRTEALSQHLAQEQTQAAAETPALKPEAPAPVLTPEAPVPAITAAAGTEAAVTAPAAPHEATVGEGLHRVGEGIGEVAASTWHGIEHGAEWTGEKVGEGAREVVHGAEWTGGKIGEGAEAVGHAAVVAAHGVEHGVEWAGEKIGEGAEAVGHAAVVAGHGVVHGVEWTGEKIGEGAEAVGHGAAVAGRGVVHGVEWTGEKIGEGASAVGHGIEHGAEAVGHGLAAAGRWVAHPFVVGYQHEDHKIHDDETAKAAKAASLSGAVNKSETQVQTLTAAPVMPAHVETETQAQGGQTH